MGKEKQEKRKPDEAVKEEQQAEDKELGELEKAQALAEANP